MKKLSTNAKILILLISLGISCYGFMIKLPVPFRKIDTEMHALYFFLAAAFLNILFQTKKISTHFLIFGMLFLFSALIEFAQEYSNAFFPKRIHGNFDPVDLKFNLIGITLFSGIWLIYFLYNKMVKPLESNNQIH
jgi:hypothetical protein